MIDSKFIKNCKELLADDQFKDLYYEFMSGGDSFYGGQAPVDFETWNRFSLDEKATLAEKTLNKTELKIKYPGTFSGPATSDLKLLIGLDEVEFFECDSMQVTSYTTLLELTNLQSVTLDIFNHSTGYIEKEWSVFDALLFVNTKSDAFKSRLNNIPKYRKELDLARPFGVYPELSAKITNGDSGFDLRFITEEFLYKIFYK